MLTKILLDRKAMTYDIVEYETKNSDNNEKKTLQSIKVLT